MGQNRKIGNVILHIFISVTSFSVGYVLSGIFNQPFCFENSISLADILNILLPFIVTLFAAWYLSKKINEDRYAKELAINDLKEIEYNITSIIKSAQTGREGVISEVVTQVNQLHLLLKRLERTCSVNGVKISTQKVMNKFYYFYGCATNFDTPLDVPHIMDYGDDLIVEIRSTMTFINKM